MNVSMYVFSSKPSEFLDLRNFFHWIRLSVYFLKTGLAEILGRVKANIKARITKLERKSICHASETLKDVKQIHQPLFIGKLNTKNASSNKGYSRFVLLIKYYQVGLRVSVRSPKLLGCFAARQSKANMFWGTIVHQPTFLKTLSFKIIVFYYTVIKLTDSHLEANIYILCFL